MEGTTTSGSPRSGSAAHPRGLAEPILDRIESHLRQRELRREALAERGRRLRRKAQGTMSRIHEGKDVGGALGEIAEESRAFAESLREDGRADEGVARDALQEAVEAMLLGAIVGGRELPGPADLGVEPEPYLLGLGDVVGEVRRLALQALSEGDVDRAEEDLALMESLYLGLMRFDTPRAVVALKPKQDAARAFIERTRGEVTMARLLARARLPPGPPPGDRT